MNPKKLVFIVALIVFLGVVIVPAFAQWQNPSQGPTGCGVNDLGCKSPINVSATPQAKIGTATGPNAGGLTLGESTASAFMFKVFGNSYFDGITNFMGQTIINGPNPLEPTIIAGNTSISGAATFVGGVTLGGGIPGGTTKILVGGEVPSRGQVLTAADDTTGLVVWQNAQVGITATGHNSQTLRNVNGLSWQAVSSIYNPITSSSTSGAVGIGPGVNGFGAALGQPDSAARLDVAGKIRIRDGNPGPGKFLTAVDVGGGVASGLAEWKYIDTDSTNISIDSTNGRLDFAACPSPSSPNQIWGWDTATQNWSCVTNPALIGGIAFNGSTARYNGTNWEANTVISIPTGTANAASISGAGTPPMANTRLSVYGGVGAADRGIYVSGTTGIYSAGPIILGTAGGSPTCDIAKRGMLWFSQNLTTDTLKVCMLYNSVYNWKNVSIP